MTPPRRRARGLGAAAATAIVAAAAVAAPALAAPSGNTTINLKGPAAKALTSQRVKLSAKKPAKAGAKRIVLPVRGATVNAKGAKLTHRGSVSLRRKVGARVRTVTLTAWQTQVGTKRSTISAKLRGKRVTLFVATAPKRRVTLNASGGAATVAGATIRLTPAGAKTLRAKLRLRRLPAARIGSGKIAAKTNAGSGGSGGSGGTGGGNTTNPGTGGGGGGGTTTPPVDQCRGVPTTEGVVPVSSDPMPPTTDARTVGSVSFVWTPKESWTQYVSTGEGASFSDGASSEPERVPGNSATLNYRFTFTPDLARSWYDPIAQKGVLHHTGTVRYLWRAHSLDITFKNPVVELDGTRSRVIFHVTGSACSRLSERATDFLAFSQAAPTSTGPAYDFGTTVPRITDGGSNAMGGMYFADSDWGAIALSLVIN